jgi:hypothetical protein
MSSPLFDRRRRSEQHHQHSMPRISLSLPRYASSSSTADKKEEDDESSTSRERFQDRREQGTVAAKSFTDLLRRYGPVFVGTYLTVYVSTVAGIFVGVESGVLDPAFILSMVADNSDPENVKSTAEIITEFLEGYSWTAPYAPTVERHPEMANLAVAWIATKFTEPVRLGVTAIIVPRVARTFGFAAKTEELEEEVIIEETKEEVSKEVSQKK